MRTGLWIGNSLGLLVLYFGFGILSVDWVISGMLNSGALLFFHWIFTKQ